MKWLQANWPQVLDLAVAHVYLTIPALLISVLIAIPVGRLAFRKPHIGGPILGVATLLYAIPALPLLILIPALTGIALRSPVTMIIALSLYGIALLVRTAADAFGSVDPQVREAAFAIGNSPRSVFGRVDLPLATPVLMSGIRVVAVPTISLVTIGALVGISNLGSLLTDGFQRGLVAEAATGIIATVILALALDGPLLLIGRLITPWTRTHRPDRLPAVDGPVPDVSIEATLA